METYGFERSKWKCHLTGDTVYHPMKGKEPNRFHRLMQRIVFGFKWVKSA
jgi:hypothetical protein